MVIQIYTNLYIYTKLKINYVFVSLFFNREKKIFPRLGVIGTSIIFTLLKGVEETFGTRLPSRSTLASSLLP